MVVRPPFFRKNDTRAFHLLDNLGMNIELTIRQAFFLPCEY